MPGTALWTKYIFLIINNNITKVLNSFETFSVVSIIKIQVKEKGFLQTYIGLCQVSKQELAFVHCVLHHIRGRVLDGNKET